jgi:hypothetical protein
MRNVLVASHENKFIEPEMYPVNGWIGTNRRRLWKKVKNVGVSLSFAESSEQSRTDLQ